jgi:hypothetical protein
MDIYHFKAPWSRLLIVLTTLLTLFLLWISCLGYFINNPVNPFLAYLPLPILIGALLFTIRGYCLTPKLLLIKRLFWHTRIDLHTLQSVEINPEATKGSIRLFGNGGLYSISGLFRNKTLGKYRAFITDPKKSVVLKFPMRTIVMSPDNPELFCQQIKALGICNLEK